MNKDGFTKILYIFYLPILEDDLGLLIFLDASYFLIKTLLRGTRKVSVGRW